MAREILRRLILIGGLLASIWLFFLAPAGVLRIATMDFAREYERARSKRQGIGFVEPGKELLPQSKGPQSIEQFIASKTADRVIVVTGPSWDSFFDRMRTEAPPGQSAFLAIGQTPLNSIQDRFRRWHEFWYIALRDGGQDRYLSANLKYPRDAIRAGAPSSLVYPRRGFSLWLLAGAVALYIVMPRMPRIPGSVGYRALSGVILPDILGSLLTCVFFALPLLIVLDFSPCATPEIFSDGRLTFFLVFWPFCIGGLVILCFAASYASTQIVIQPDALCRVTPGGAEPFPFASIASIDRVERRTPTWLKVLATIVALSNWCASAAAGSLRRYHRLGIDIRRNDGGRLRIWSDMPGFERIAEALQAAGLTVPLDMVATEIDEDE